MARSEINDSVDTGGNGFVQFDDGIVGGGFEATGSSVINIAGGTFENVLSDGEVVLASGGTINITGGTFGAAGVDDGGSIGAALGGTVNMTGGTIAGGSGWDRADSNIECRAKWDGFTEQR